LAIRREHLHLPEERLVSAEVGALAGEADMDMVEVGEEALVTWVHGVAAEEEDLVEPEHGVGVVEAGLIPMEALELGHGEPHKEASEEEDRPFGNGTNDDDILTYQRDFLYDLILV